MRDRNVKKYRRVKAMRNISFILIFACVIALLSSGAYQALAAVTIQEKYKDIEIVEPRLAIDGRQFTREAYLHMAVKNNGDKEITNMALQMSYYGDEGYLIHKVVIKNALNDVIGPGETKAYKIELKGNFVNPDHQQYPYSKGEKVRDFDIDIVDVKYAR